MKNKDTAIFRYGQKIAEVHRCTSSVETGVGLLKTPELKRENGLHTGIIMPIPVSRQKYSGFINSIHMIGMKYPIAVFWVDKDGVVVTKVYAMPGFRVYSPKKPSVCVIELNSEAYHAIDVGDKLVFEDLNT